MGVMDADRISCLIRLTSEVLSLAAMIIFFFWKRRPMYFVVAALSMHKAWEELEGWRATDQSEERLLELKRIEKTSSCTVVADMYTLSVNSFSIVEVHCELGIRLQQNESFAYWTSRICNQKSSWASLSGFETLMKIRFAWPSGIWVSDSRVSQLSMSNYDLSYLSL